MNKTHKQQQPVKESEERAEEGMEDLLREREHRRRAEEENKILRAEIEVS